MTKTYRLKIERDEDPRDPREDDNMCAMWLWHKRARLGEEKPEGLLDRYQAMCHLLAEQDREFVDELAQYSSSHTPKECSELIEKEFGRHYIWSLVYAYEHSGITISLKPFSCRFDSGVLGIIFVERQDAITQLMYEPSLHEGLGAYVERVTREEMAIEVQQYDDYLQGNVYGFVLESHVWPFEIPGHGVDISDNTLDWDDEESAWGFYGDNPTVNGISEHLEQRFPGAVKLAYDNLGKWVHVTPKETT